jgi:RNA polymerase sigma-70 factor (ECF subfamily)
MTAAPSTRASLLLRLRDPQDHPAWVEFVTLYEPVIYRMLRRHSLQDSDARELMQELLLAVSSNIDRWDPARERGSFGGWLRRVTRNLVINWLNHRDRRVVATGGSDMLSLFDMLPAAQEPASAEFDHELRWSMFQRAAHEVRAEVQPATWAAFWETSVAGTSPADAAGKLGLSVGAIRVAKCRVLARLRTKVNELEEAT